MRNHLAKSLITCILFAFAIVTYATPHQTKRVSALSNDKVNVWETVIYPGKSQQLKMHRHDHDRLLIALNDGKLKVVNGAGKTSYINLTKNKAYYFKRDAVNELHTDENMNTHPVKVLVVELK